MGKSSECIGGEFLMADNVSPILMTDYLVTNTEMTAVADAIRGTAGTAGQLSFPDGFVSAIQGIKTEPTLQEKTVTPSTSAQTVTPDAGYDGLSKVAIGAVPTAIQATPSITVSSSGLITATSEQSEGYVALGAKSSTKQLTTQAAKTVTPGTADQTAIASGCYTTGAVTVKGDANLVAGNIKSGVSIFGVTGNLKSTSKTLNFASMHQSLSTSVSSDGYVGITVSKSMIEQFHTPNLVYVEGTAYDAYTGDDAAIIFATRTGDNQFLCSVFHSNGGFASETLTFAESTNTSYKLWQWPIDPELIMATDSHRVIIKTIVLGS